MRVDAAHLGLFVQARYSVPEMPIIGTDWPAVGMADFVPGKFAVPQNPISLAGLADFVAGTFAVPQNPILDAGMGDLVSTAPMYPLHENSVLEEAQNLGLAGLAAGSDCGCGCGGHGCSGGMSGIGDFSSFVSDQMNKIAAGDIATIAMWGGGALLVMFLLFGSRKGGRSAYRSKKSELQKEYSAKLRELRAASPTTVGRLVHAGRAARAAF